MSFFTSLTGLRAANTELAITSNNIANSGTTGFKKSEASFGDIFARSPLQTQTVGQGVALKSISQEFSQGSIEFSSNTLDLAISGDGFFPLVSQDGQTELFSRSGAFLLDEAGNVVNKSGQRLLASQVDASGNAIGGALQTISILPQTIGEASATTKVGLSINLPSGGEVIDLPFDAGNPKSYNKSFVIDLFDAGGNAYPATIYFVKTSNASAVNATGSTYNPNANQPTSKWQTHIVIDGVEVMPALQQASNPRGEALYVNQYGEVKSQSEVAEELVPGKTPKFTLDDLASIKPSVAASVSGSEVPNDLSLNQGFNFFEDLLSEDAVFTQESLEEFVKIDVDGSGNPVTINLAELAQTDRAVSGAEIAKFIENQLNEAFGDQRFFDLTLASNREFKLNYTLGGQTTEIEIDLSLDFPDVESQTVATTEAVRQSIQRQIDAVIGEGAVQVTYDAEGRNFRYVPTNATADLSLEAGASGSNTLFGLTSLAVSLDSSGLDSSGFNVIPNGSFIREADEQRYGLKVSFNAVTNNFSFASGSTGDNSSIEMNFDTGNLADPNFNAAAAVFLGYAVTEDDPALKVQASDYALRGLASTPAVTFGTPVALDVENVFAVTPQNNAFNVTVDGISGEIRIPAAANYTIDSFTSELSRQINQLAKEDGSTISGVSVEYDGDLKSFVFTSGTTGNSSFIKVTGDSVWGLAQTSPGRGITTTWIQPEQSIEMINGSPQAVYIDEFGNETTDPTGFTELPAWSPIFLDKGELTFDKQGNLVSPAGGLEMETAFLAGGGSLDLTFDFSGTTQFNQNFNVRNQNQDGLPEGNLVGLDIGSDGLIVASYSNGSQVSVGKLLLANFPSTDGLSAKGDSAFLATAKSGNAIFGEAGSSSFGTIRAGALERSNVDLTTELIGLISAQRNFQANAKAIETSSTLTSTILNI